MKPLKNPYVSFGKIAIILGALFLGISLFFVLLWFISGYLYGFGLTAIILCFQGVLWCIIGLCFYIHVKSKNAKCERLKKDGLRYDAEIVQLKINPFIRIGGYITVYAECSYQDQNGKVCLVKSDSFLQNIPREALRATVYVSQNNPLDYYIEIFDDTEMNIKYDYDYR